MRQILKNHNYSEVLKNDDYKSIDTLDNQIVDKIHQEMKEKKIQIQMDENTELNAFCSLIETHFGAPSYEQYEEALSTTKKGRILFFEKTN